MPDSCDTKYFVQLDADMILNSDAIYKLYYQIKKSSFNTYRISGQLFEDGFGIGGHIKCWKKSIFKYFKFKDTRTVDRNFHKKVRMFGFYNKVINENFGVHKPRHSNFSNYLKTKSDIEKWRFLKRPFNLYAEELLKKIIISKDIYRLNGFLFGVLSFKRELLKSKNLKFENELYKNIFTLFDIENIDEKIFKLNDIDELIKLIKDCYNLYEIDSVKKKEELFFQFANYYGLNHDISQRVFQYIKN